MARAQAKEKPVPAPKNINGCNLKKKQNINGANCTNIVHSPERLNKSSNSQVNSCKIKL